MISQKSWSIDAVARLVCGVIVTACAGIILAGLLNIKKLAMAAGQIEFLQIMLSILFLQGGVLIWVALFLRESKLSWREAFGLRPPSRLKAISSGLLVGLMIVPAAGAMQLLSETVMEMLGARPQAQEAVKALETGGMTATESMLLGGFAILLAPIAEETLFRGVLYPTIKQLGYPRLALWATSILFGALHGNSPTLFPLVMLGLLFVYLYEASGSLLTPIAAHMMFNTANFVYMMIPHVIARRLHLP